MRPPIPRAATWRLPALPMIGAAAIALLAGCAAPPSPVVDAAAACVQPDAHRMLQADLLFGRDIAGRDPVTDAERAAFLADVVTPRFPDSFTY
ncbi:putative lipoprotein [Burkholderia cepacia GG4]|uniref:Lipoprotein n=1 Tax=Burkholderia cepacia GG4 TaxID=1009846 RepID=A0A9W3P901_BURCE|nr:putative lipoprotein [Burkholderia cepacia GG4]